MNKIILLLAMIVLIAACKDKPTFSEEELQKAKFEVQLAHDSADIHDLQEYLSWESDMHKSMLGLGYSEKKRQYLIDSMQMKHYLRDKSLIPKWYIRYRKSNDSTFSIPDSLARNY